MTFNHSKLLAIMLWLISIVLLAVLTLGVYSIRVKNKGTSELLNLADETVEREILAQSIRMLQNNAQEDLAAFNNFVLSGDKLVSLIESIEETGRTLGLDTEIVSVGKIEDKRSIEPDIIRIVIESQGSWAPILSFLRAIESLPYRVMIDESGLSKVEIGWRSKIILSLHSFD